MSLLSFLVLGHALAADPITLDVDASEAPRRILHAVLKIPAAPGPLALQIPKWIPGEHGPTGPLAALSGLQIRANGQVVPWTRDPIDPWTLRVTVPAGASALDVQLDDLLSVDPDNFTQGPSTTPTLGVISWNQLVLYPGGGKASDIQVVASLKVPSGWKWHTALPVASEQADTIRFQPASLDTLVDSPVLTGRLLNVYPLAPDEKPAHSLAVASDGAPAIALPPEFLEAQSNLVREAGLLFGARHYRRYDFLLTLSDQVAHFGLEHHESSDNRLPERIFTDESTRGLFGDLLAHEFVHSWNGKYRRPAGLAIPAFDTPMNDELLWVYEGLTHYLGYVLAARSGAWSQEELREHIAVHTAYLEQAPGRTWRPLQDTATAADSLYSAPFAWSSARRSVDFYSEGVVLWLEVDTTIRDQSKGKKSLDDFVRAFHGGKSGPPQVVPYTIEDVVAALNAVVPLDWTTFFRERLDQTSRSLVPALHSAGWTLIYNDERPAYVDAAEAVFETTNRGFSLGVWLTPEGVVADVVPGLPAGRAGVAPGMRIVAVNDRAYSVEVLDEALAAAKAAPQPIRLLVDNAGWFSVLPVDYSEGQRWPHLDPLGKKTDWLTVIATPRYVAPPKKGPK